MGGRRGGLTRASAEIDQEDQHDDQQQQHHADHHGAAHPIGLCGFRADRPHHPTHGATIGMPRAPTGYATPWMPDVGATLGVITVARWSMRTW
jgi:hypothetical protein